VGNVIAIDKVCIAKVTEEVLEHTLPIVQLARPLWQHPGDDERE
jgi:hypothetical protein